MQIMVGCTEGVFAPLVLFEVTDIELLPVDVTAPLVDPVHADPVDPELPNRVIVPLFGTLTVDDTLIELLPDDVMPVGS